MSVCDDVRFRARFCNLKKNQVLWPWDRLYGKPLHFSPVQTFFVTGSRRNAMGGILYRVTDLGKEYAVHADDVDVYEIPVEGERCTNA